MSFIYMENVTAELSNIKKVIYPYEGCMKYGKEHLSVLLVFQKPLSSQVLPIKSHLEIFRPKKQVVLFPEIDRIKTLSFTRS